MIRRLSQLAQCVFLRPSLALCLFGALSLVFNWLWIGSGLFLGHGVGVAIWLTGLATTGLAAVALGRRRHELAALLLLIVATIALPTIALMLLRWKTGAPILMHDGAYQTEEAIKLVLAGHYPYGFDYTTSSMRLWAWYDGVPVPANLYHFLYSPPAFLLPLPIYALTHWLGWPFDVRLVDLGVEAIAVGAVLRLGWRWQWKYVLLCALFLDPFFYLAQGRNDILFLTAVIVAVLAWQRNQLFAAALGFGLAWAFKPFAIFFVPLVALLLIRGARRDAWGLGRLAVVLSALALPALVMIGPFLAWNPGAYWADTVSFVTGSGPHPYAIQGYGFSEILLRLKMIPNSNAYFPFTVVEALTVGPLSLLAAFRVWRSGTLGSALRWGTGLLAVFLFFSRVLNDNYIATIVLLGVLAGTTGRSEEEDIDIHSRHNRADVSLVALRAHRLRGRIFARPRDLGGDGSQSPAAGAG